MRTARTTRPALLPRTRSVVFASALAALALFAGACSGDSGSDSASGSSSDSADGGKGADADKAFKERECLRKQGLEVAEPKSGEDVRGITIGGDMSKEKMEAALKKCGAGGGRSGKGPSQADKDKMLKYAQCMRRNGFDMPDPKFDGGAMQAQPMPKGAEAKKMEKAAEACKGIVK
ncbi:MULTISPECIES: hypothetical protein [Streptomyces]|uniref:Secreted protein n=1 Tax=Streptomyces venezuelae TaxID=54571 RepID=A0A5P2BHP3_STRVZ|nr:MULTISPECIES: hypothetical protein [Streptomyces]NEA03142.1 hypothetical protein [Streptomyces sp. SID10116]MYY84942.1 hypothetical protein [Streptomyces sp. SID335]MYZ16787.1 hypothetical protein [Streptomyces sp. SID337]NDZ90613.1 hypothetical protein [Streptomyces sp. SID10115]NEB49334.1 hypothetical protein [Streptomyces sp. SID339]